MFAPHFSQFHDFLDKHPKKNCKRPGLLTVIKMLINRFNPLFIHRLIFCMHWVKTFLYLLKQWRTYGLPNKTNLCGQIP